MGWDARGLETLKRGRFTVSDILLEKEEGRLSAKAMELYLVLASPQRTLLPSTSLMSCCPQQVHCAITSDSLSVTVNVTPVVASIADQYFSADTTVVPTKCALLLPYFQDNV